jgi:EAL domain-containing protein (putative c-di-GMP-specific phosphodiesterase class I)
MSKSQPPSEGSHWYLEGAVDESGQVFRMPILSTPFRVGRESGLDLSLPAQVVSSQHAELFRKDDRLLVRDLGSTNGTFVNQEPILGEADLKEGDILHFATFAFRLGVSRGKHSDTIMGSTAVIPTGMHTLVPDQLLKLRRLLADKAVTQLYQPIVGLDDHEVIGYEVLGRGALEGLPSGIKELFELAAIADAEVDLSVLLRQQSIAASGELAGDYCYFLNTHPAELHDDSLLASLRLIRSEWPELRLAIEIHEGAVTDPESIKKLQLGLQELDMLLVYDDFGSGQARLLELADVPPAFLKFDQSLIRKIDQAKSSRQRLLEGLVKLALDLGIDIIAEGIETRSELGVCRDLGFGYGQGFLFAEPKASEQDGDIAVPPPLEAFE